MGMILRIASSRIVGQGDIVGRSGYFSLNLSANSVMRGRLDARRTLKSLVADLRNNKNNTPFKAEDVNWEELAGIGILKDELEMSGELDTLLKGEKTGVMSLSLVLLGVDVVMDATLQLVRKDDGALIEILGVKPVA